MADCKSAGTPNGGKDISGATDLAFNPPLGVEGTEKDAYFWKNE